MHLPPPLCSRAVDNQTPVIKCFGGFSPTGEGMRRFIKQPQSRQRTFDFLHGCSEHELLEELHCIFCKAHGSSGLVAFFLALRVLPINFRFRSGE